MIVSVDFGIARVAKVMVSVAEMAAEAVALEEEMEEPLLALLVYSRLFCIIENKFPYLYPLL